MKSKNLDKSHQKESLIIERLISLFAPSKVKRISSVKVVGDISVEILNPLSNTDKRLSIGRKFHITLIEKSDDVKAISISSSKLSEWQRSKTPLMLVNEMDEALMYFWIDESLYSALRSQYGPGWMGKKMLQIPLNSFKKLDAGSVSEVESYLITNIKGQEKSLPKGAFFTFRNELKKEITDFINYADQMQLPVENSTVKSLLQKAENAIYTISIVGPSRAGKSTLINTLMEREISPVNVLPTTGVPFTIQPGQTNEAIVSFFDRPDERGPANIKFLGAYVDQKHNPRNKENVKLVTVYLENEQLQNGLAFCDVPGLDDVNDDIRRVSMIAVYSSNAIIYLIDVAPYKYGSFSLNTHHLSDLRDLAPKMDKVFLVFNKVDILTNKELTALKTYIDAVLHENDLLKFLPTPPIYVSAKSSFENVSGKGKGQSNYNITELTNALWDNLLKNNKNGLHNIGGLIYEFKSELNELKIIMKTRLKDSSEAAVLSSNLNRVRKQLPTMTNVGEDGKEELLTWLKDYIQQSTEDVLINLENELRNVPENMALPNSHSIRQYLESNAYAVLNQIYDEVNFRLDNLYGDLNSWVKNELSQQEFYSEEEYEPMRDKRNIDQIIRPIRDSFTQNLPMALSLLEKTVSFLGEAIGGLFQFLEVLFVGKTKIREDQIRKIMTKARHSYFGVFNKAQVQFSSFVKSQYNAMIKQLRDRTEVYIGEIHKQLHKLNQPPDPILKQKYEEGDIKISEIQVKLDRLKNDLSAYL